MERKHDEAESQRTVREKELTSEILERDNDIKEVREQLDRLRTKSDKIKQKAADEVVALKDKIRQQKDEEMKRLNEDIKKIMEIEAEKNGMQEQIERERKEMREKWDTATISIKEQKEQLLQMKQDYENEFSSLEKDKRPTRHEKEQFEREKHAALSKIRASENELKGLYSQRLEAVASAEGEVRMKREVLELEYEEKQVELDSEKTRLADKIVEHEAIMDHAADSLANVQYQLEVKTLEENQKIDSAKERFNELQRKLAESAKKAEDDLEAKRRQYDEVSDKRRETIAKEREIVTTMRTELGALVEKLEHSKGNERNNIEKDIQTKRKRLNEQESQLKLLEIEHKNISDDIEVEFEEELNQIQSKAQQDQTALELERLNLEELQDAKTLKLQKEEQELREAQKRYNEVKMALGDSRKKLQHVEKMAEETSRKKQSEFVKMCKTLEENLAGTEQQPEAYKLRERLIHLKEIDVEGKMDLAEQKEKNSVNTEQVNSDIKRLTYELDDRRKAKEKLENELKELKEKFERQRMEETATLDAMKESIQDMEEEDSLGRSLTENEIIYTAKGTVPLNKLLEKEKIRSVGGSYRGINDIDDCAS